MSIEALIQAHTEALLANTEAVKLLTLSLAGRTPKAEDKPKQSKNEPVVVVNEKKEKAAEKASTDEAQEAIDKEQDEKTEGGATSYETLRELVLRLASGGQREGIKAVSAKHGIAAPKDLLKDANDYSSVTDQEKLEAVYTDLLALEA